MKQYTVNTYKYILVGLTIDNPTPIVEEVISPTRISRRKLYTGFQERYQTRPALTEIKISTMYEHNPQGEPTKIKTTEKELQK